MKLNSQHFQLLIILSFLLIYSSCQKISEVTFPTEPNEEVIDFPEIEGLEVFDPAKVDDNYILVNDASTNRVYLMDKTTEIIHEWNLNGQRLGNNAFLLPNGKLLAMLEAQNPEITLGGFGGVISILDKDGNAEWTYEYSNEDHVAHHEAIQIPNGNILFLSWEKKSAEEASAIGFSAGTQIIYDAVLEIDPTTNEIIWSWHLWDHLIQDFDESKQNFGNVSENPQRIDVNNLEVPNNDGDISHVNGLVYDAEKDIIYLSANFYSEIWVIDHSTTTEEAQSNLGGNFNKGGELLYRFGNPDAYKNEQGLRRFDRNHHPNLLSGTKMGNMLIFANGFSKEQSEVYEFDISQLKPLTPNTDNEPTVVWNFTDTNLYSGRVSGVDLLSNGNRLITEGDFGFWEVTEDGEVVWKFETPGFFWRAYHYDKNSPGVLLLEL